VRLSGAGLMYGAEGDWVAWLYGNLILVILGNIIGGGLVVGTQFTCFTGTNLLVQND
jgi:formate/nitrite transporter FocA (FNT family)